MPEYWKICFWVTTSFDPQAIHFFLQSIVISILFLSGFFTIFNVFCRVSRRFGLKNCSRSSQRFQLLLFITWNSWMPFSVNFLPYLLICFFFLFIFSRFFPLKQVCKDDLKGTCHKKYNNTFNSWRPINDTLVLNESVSIFATDFQ